VQDFDMLDWKAIYNLVDVGYEYARKQLPQWLEANPAVRMRERVF
jgi:hypothetical protein